MARESVMNKRGQDLSVTALILIIVGVVILVFLIYGFTVGWGNVIDKITNYGGGKSNVASVVQGCQVACNTQDSYAYNDLKRDIVFEDKSKASASCRDLEVDKKAECSLGSISVAGADWTKVNCKGKGAFVAEGAKCKLGELVVTSASTPAITWTDSNCNVASSFKQNWPTAIISSACDKLA